MSCKDRIYIQRLHNRSRQSDGNIVVSVKKYIEVASTTFTTVGGAISGSDGRVGQEDGRSNIQWKGRTREILKTHEESLGGVLYGAVINVPNGDIKKSFLVPRG